MRGMFIDQQRRADMIRDLSGRIEEMDAQLSLVGITNPDSTRTTAAELRALGVPLTKKTESGQQFKIDLEVLGWIDFYQNTRPAAAGRPMKFPFLRDMIERSKLAKARRNLHSLRICDDGFLRTRLNALGTRTLRYSSSGWGRKGKPGYCPECGRWAADGHGCNLQNIPKDNAELGVNVKDVFVARPGWKMGELDYRALELDIQAVRIKCRKLYERLHTPGMDMHSIHATLRWPDFDKKAADGPRKRTLAKNIIYGLRGGGGDRALQIACAKKGEFVELSEFTRFRKVIFGEYPEMPAWIEEVGAELNRQHFAGELRVIRNGFDRPRVLFGSHKDVLKEALADNISSTGSSGLNYVIYRLAEEHPGAFRYVNMQIHDSLMVHAPEDRFDDVMGTVKEEMERPWWMWDELVPMQVDAKCGERWAGMEEWKG